jgi:cation transport regulator
MPYQAAKDLPDSIKDVLPHHALDIFMAAYNNAYESYKDPKDRRGNETHDEVAFKVAWGAVKREYKKGDDGKWHRKAA